KLLHTVRRPTSSGPPGGRRAEAMPAPTSPTVRRRRLAAELRRLRDLLDLTLEEVAERLNWSASKLSRIETAKSGAKIIDVRGLRRTDHDRPAAGPRPIARADQVARHRTAPASEDPHPRAPAGLPLRDRRIGAPAQLRRAPGDARTADQAAGDVQASQCQHPH